MTENGYNVNIEELILDSLIEVNEKGRYSHMVINGVLDKYAYLPKRDRAFLTIVFEGTIERMITLDYVLGLFSKTPVRKMKPLIRNLLRSSLYQIMYLDGVPDSHVVNAAVKLAGKRGFKGLQGFVNGLLRNIIRNQESIEMPDENTDPVKALSVVYSVPEWIAARFINLYGRDTATIILAQSLEEAGTVIRINEGATGMHEDQLRSEMKAAGITVEDTSLTNAWKISGFDRLRNVVGFESGLFQVQDISSIRVGNLISEHACVKGAQVLDVCAAPGGKSIHMMDMGAFVTACDISERKAALIEENAAKYDSGRLYPVLETDRKVDSHSNGIRVLVKDASEICDEFTEKYDIVIADVPCSGLGVLGRKVDLKYRVTEDDIKEISGLQESILMNAVTYVKPGGVLSFSTCTLTREENEMNRDKLLETGKLELVCEEKRIPGIDEGDGFYIAIFKKQG